MTLPIRILPILERWDCTGCGLCCRGNMVPLDDDDLRKLREQDWDNHPDFLGVRTKVRQGLRGKSYRLAQRGDGTCVFLMEDGLCRIHKEFGLEAKPLVCQMYPLQLIPLQNNAVLTLRRSCPTAAADRGKLLKTYRNAAEHLGTRRKLLAKASRPPKIIEKRRASWEDPLPVMDGIERLLTDDRYPMVRRMVHGLNFCRLLEACRLKRLDSTQLTELVTILLESSYQEASELFRERKPPTRSGAVLFRQCAAEYLRLHPKFIVQETWGQRFRLIPMALKMARGKGTTPQFHPDLPVTTFETLERPLGHLAEEVQRPFNRYFEVNVATRQYAVASKPGWSIIESFRDLALSYSVALWILRLCCTDSEPTHQDSIDLVTLIDRGQGYGPLEGGHHRRRVDTLARLNQLERLAAWYAR
ncbi:MAG: YkgJ family cysteine cluster protein [Pirellulaceae bacterium]